MFVLFFLALVSYRGLASPPHFALPFFISWFSAQYAFLVWKSLPPPFFLLLPLTSISNLTYRDDCPLISFLSLSRILVQIRFLFSSCDYLLKLEMKSPTFRTFPLLFTFSSSLLTGRSPHGMKRWSPVLPLLQSVNCNPCLLVSR